MSITEIIIKIVGIILVVVGVGLLLSVVGLNILGAGIDPWWLSLILGVIFIALGLLLVRGGNISL